MTVKITIISPLNPLFWRPRGRTRPAFSTVLHCIGERAIGRLRRRLAFDELSHFRHAVEWITVELFQAAATLLVSGQDVRGKNGYIVLSRLLEQRLSTSHEEIAARIQAARPVIRKAILAAAFAWLRIQFPALNAVSAVAAAELITKLLRSR